MIGRPRPSSVYLTEEQVMKLWRESMEDNEAEAGNPTEGEDVFPPELQLQRMNSADINFMRRLQSVIPPSSYRVMDFKICCRLKCQMMLTVVVLYHHNSQACRVWVLHIAKVAYFFSSF